MNDSPSFTQIDETAPNLDQKFPDDEIGIFFTYFI